MGLVTALFLGLAMVGVTAANTVAAGSVDDVAVPQGANDLKPPECDGIVLTEVRTGSLGTSASELVLGTSGIDVVSASGGDDCVLGGGGDDDLRGGAGTDVCIGGAGTDLFLDCETALQ